MAADMSGAVSLNRVIASECQLQSEGLSLIVRRTFPRDITKLLQASLAKRKYWLVLVRASRKLAHNIRIQDEFTNPKSNLREWVGL